MCGICNDKKCQNELKHLAVEMLRPAVEKEFPNLKFAINPNSLHIVRQSINVLKIAFYGDRMKVWRCIPRYETPPFEILAADPDFIEQIMRILTGKEPIVILNSKY
jgi:hypothetical protein